MKKSKIFERIKSRTPDEIKKKVSEAFEISNRIAEILQKQGKSQRAFAELMGKRESEISKWLSGTHNFTVDTLSGIQEKLGERVFEVRSDDFIYVVLNGQTFKVVKPNERKLCVNVFESKLATPFPVSGKLSEKIKRLQDELKSIKAQPNRYKALGGVCAVVDYDINKKMAVLPVRATAHWKEKPKRYFSEVRVKVNKTGYDESSNLTPISMYHHEQNI